MRDPFWPKKKVALLIGIIGIYVLLAGLIYSGVLLGIIPRSPPPAIQVAGSDTISEAAADSPVLSLQSAESFFQKNLIESNGHVDLYITPGNNKSLEDTSTNSEAASYYLLWTAQANDKKNFDMELAFMQRYMLQPRYNYLMWHLDKDDKAVGDGSNIATDADLRAIKALLIAEKQWKDKSYTDAIDKIASGIEKVGITSDGYLAPYGGVSGDTATWTAQEVWLSYSDFTVFRALADRRGKVWAGVYSKMKQASLNAQIANGLYNTMLTQNREYGNSIDAGGYSINSAWMMVRNAESGDADLMKSANRSLQFYRNKLSSDSELYANYNSNGDALNPSDTPWIYALVGRAAVALSDRQFSDAVMQKLLEHQVKDNQSAIFGAFPEGYGSQARIGQFTMQESILTMQDYITEGYGAPNSSGK